MSVQFPEGFRFGAATAAYQIEGAAAEDGKVDSIWDVFCRQPGRITNGEDGTLACDHYHRYAADVAMMADLGVNTYRFSVSWPRVMNDAQVNSKGLDFYSRLVDELLAKGITPWLTLYHWDLPAALPGGWTNRDTAARFADYAATVHRRLGDRVRTWTTLNEPWCSAFLGHASGQHAPGLTDPVASIRAAHHLMLGHGLAIQALAAADSEAKLGITLNFTPAMPATNAPADIDVARRIDGTANRFFADAIFKGLYPADVLDDLAAIWPADLVREGDLRAISTPIDVLGVNYYTTNVFAAGDGSPAGRPSPHITAPAAKQVLRDRPLTDMGWEIEPSGLKRLLVRLHEDYTGASGTALVITENGAAFPDQPDADGFVDDTTDRLDFVRRHLLAAHQALQLGVNLQGYLVWSLIDNFEWSWGYGKRFGIVRVDEALNRIPKASAQWYAEVARTGEVSTTPIEPRVKAEPESVVVPLLPRPESPQSPSAELPRLPRSPWSPDAPSPSAEPPKLPASPWSADLPPAMEVPQLPASPWSADPPPSVEAPRWPISPQLPASPWSADLPPSAEVPLSEEVPRSPTTPQLPASPWSADIP
ncbi:MAG: GH1 family beta-glucosidase [Propionicimonas sp.]|uniref:GH1 family beta-glucosidase n=1 Tax=Propionicimonas sp. TaxID=1955623 RepID=UPI001DE05F01|nr:GH1 family beta-glucosidase [Propionicimonas sp.]MBU4188355.1 beta-glucosidase [Actinomycetota bacterium]MBU4206477.1 beta-glucosidase [Actinomycetota bacterium]MBU4250402.1 beta-glucosidase [Actinomycetota bacterium]MBU4363452.1 beta-glucosidase [Actinomycetota bacterium]MBU4409007.1 beta-glucosidase [Actinomycetota bacterium]